MKLSKNLEAVIGGGYYYSESVLGEAKLHCSSQDQFDALEGYLNGNATTEHWRTLQMMVIELHRKGL